MVEFPLKYYRWVPIILVCPIMGSGETMLITTYSCVRSYAVDNKQIENIKIFDETGVVFETKRGWFEHKHGEDRRGTRDVRSIEFPDIKRRVKENFKHKEPYRLKNTLYIPAALVEFKPLGEKLALETETEKHYHQHYSLKLTCTLFAYDFEADTDYGDLKERSLEITSSRFTRTEKTDFGAQVLEAQNMLNAKDVNISKYDLEKILAHFTIEPKG